MIPRILRSVSETGSFDEDVSISLDAISNIDGLLMKFVIPIRCDWNITRAFPKKKSSNFFQSFILQKNGV